MSPAEVRAMGDREIVQMLISLDPSEKDIGLLIAVLTDSAAFEGVRELRRRFNASQEVSAPKTATGRIAGARTVFIDRDRWKAFFWRRRIALVDVGGLMEPARCDGWASAIGSQGKASLYALDDLACALDLHVDDLIEQVGTDDELARLALNV